MSHRHGQATCNLLLCYKESVFHQIYLFLSKYDCKATDIHSESLTQYMSCLCLGPIGYEHNCVFILSSSLLINTKVLIMIWISYGITQNIRYLYQFQSHNQIFHPISLIVHCYHYKSSIPNRKLHCSRHLYCIIFSRNNLNWLEYEKITCFIFVIPTLSNWFNCTFVPFQTDADMF